MALDHVTVLGFRKVLGTSITIPMEMLNAADLISRISRHGKERLVMDVASIPGGALEMTSGLVVADTRPLHSITATDLVIVPALWGNPRGVVMQHPEILSFLRQQHACGAIICGVGTGSFFMAEAGLLDDRQATTHWYYFDAFATRYPKVRMQRDRFITRADTLYCAGSVNSVRDVMLYLIEEFHGHTVAHEVSRHFTHEIKRSYDSSYLRHSPQDSHDDEAVIGIQEWMLSRYHADISLQGLAHQFGMSTRTLNRHFRHATGKSPMQYLQQVRLDNARELLRNTNLSVAEIAYRVGYADTSYFSALFRRNLDMSPREYRSLVRKKVFSVES